MTSDETRGDIDDLDEFAYLLHVAHRELDSIPYTAPEVFVGRLRELIPLYSVLVAEVRVLRDQRDKALARVDELTARRRIPVPPPEPGMAATVADLGTGKDTE